MKTQIFNNNNKPEIYPNKHFTDSKGNKISIGDRVRVLWGFDNRIHVGEIIDFQDRTIRIDTINRRINTIDHNKITKVMWNQKRERRMIYQIPHFFIL